MAKQLKRLVSKKKRRFTENGYDLDLTYIRPNILAMGFPSESIEGIYRNNLDEVVRFLDSYHGDNYKVYNLCAERTYDASKFHGRVACYPFEDHNAPPFPLFDAFCSDVSSYLNADSRNVAAVHCKAGKGRTGVMICAFFIHENIFKAVPEALMFYDLKRTQNGKGVTIPSQRRYVEYYGYRKIKQLTIRPVKLLLYGFIFDGVPAYSNMGNYSIFYKISQGKKRTLVSRFYEVDIRRKDGQTFMELDSPVAVTEDIKTEFFFARLGKKQKAFHCWLNTYFIHAAMQHGDDGLYSMRTSQLASDLQLVPYAIPAEQHNPIDLSRRGTLDHAPTYMNNDGSQQMTVISLPKKDLDRACKDHKHVANKFRLHALFSPEVESDSMNPSTIQEIGVTLSPDISTCPSVISGDSKLSSSSSEDEEESSGTNTESNDTSDDA
ncbi:phosphatidylinositol 3,4,5-trisphosphate 3-phosphatase and dual-specificity protein phosphatase PTEN-like [Sycon ciliatum]|uniref:phosphatidylinositol 3,4,5-trisphosphate 3-phosphatase and dual-specificity protein phosphatase PTEN-like n=1 Tax=Sycon ciliatum TaxID=27933 RepID=UPI0020A93E79|eukprot:scpid49201/ scgid28895/ Phosphatidylinositol 3,4,5-trisphosphate 3-phosphatase and dual-specificity protein phosphatase PTEN; Mutated in multiple advanced cancers 1; Phosphatase and tensin homolog